MTTSEILERLETLEEQVLDAWDRDAREIALDELMTFVLEVLYGGDDDDKETPNGRSADHV